MNETKEDVGERVFRIVNRLMMIKEFSRANKLFLYPSPYNETFRNIFNNLFPWIQFVNCENAEIRLCFAKKCDLEGNFIPYTNVVLEKPCIVLCFEHQLTSRIKHKNNDKVKYVVSEYFVIEKKKSGKK
jgi:hypothetical protein